MTPTEPGAGERLDELDRPRIRYAGFDGSPTRFRRVDKKSPWTEALVDALRTRWAGGDSASQIAAFLGQPFTRSSVLGKAHRLNLPGRVPSVVLARLQAKQRRRKSPVTVPKAGRMKAWIKGTAPPEYRFKDVPLPPPTGLKGKHWDALPGTSPVALVDLVHGMCKWPIGLDRPYRFCGADSGDEVYCKTHTKVARSGATSTFSPHITGTGTNGEDGLAKRAEPAVTV